MTIAVIKEGVRVDEKYFFRAIFNIHEDDDDDDDDDDERIFF